MPFAMCHRRYDAYIGDFLGRNRASIDEAIAIEIRTEYSWRRKSTVVNMHSRMDNLTASVVNGLLHLVTRFVTPLLSERKL